MRQVRLTPQAVKDLKPFDELTRSRLKEALRYLAEHPLEGKPLKGQFQKDKVWPYRVWPYRVLYRRVGSGWLDVLSIEHRKDVYR
ncbi:MAG: type II toxin-antitoxin system RelE/ParE family toxin [Nitrospira sp.]|nr:type II toxin-antitoxin system RelE/ParE family toxin [Nitrospira sp.]